MGCVLYFGVLLVYLKFWAGQEPKFPVLLWLPPGTWEVAAARLIVIISCEDHGLGLWVSFLLSITPSRGQVRSFVKEV